MNPFDPFAFPGLFGTGFRASTTPLRAEPPAAKSPITVQDLIDRGSSIVRVGEKVYRITAKEVEYTKG